MKSRLSFVTRRPSTKPEALSPRGNKDPNFDDNATPMPEPLVAPEAIPRPSTLGLPTPRGADTGNSFETSPNPSKARSKSVLGDMVGGKKKQSTLGQEPQALGVGPGPGAVATSTDEVTGAQQQVFPASVREGFLRKKGVINVAWKRRYIVLLPHQLAYYDEQPTSADAMPKGFINLASILKCEHHDPVNSQKDFMFNVITPTRIFRLQAESLADMDAWIASISGTAANEQQIIASRKRNVSHAARNLAEQDRIKIEDSATIPHENSELKRWPTWNPFEVAAWIQTFGMGRYSQPFYEKGIKGEDLKTMDDNGLTALGVDEKSDRVKILANIKKLIQDTKRA